MIKINNGKCYTFGIAIACIALFSFSLSASAQQTLRVMSYNVENLYDTVDDPETNDNEFLPNGIRNWTNSRYNDKLQHLAKVISAAGGWDSPTLVGLCEVENETVLDDLVHRTSLKKQNYLYFISHGDDKRGINCGLLVQRDRFKFIGKSEHKVRFTKKDSNRHTRNILHIWGKVITGDTLDVFVCHFPSKYSGAQETQSARNSAASTLRSLCDSIFAERACPQLVIMGDFNDSPNVEAIRDVLGAQGFKGNTKTTPKKGDALHLVNLFASSKDADYSGSEKYQGEWSQLDQMIVSDNLINENARMYVKAKSIQIFHPSFLLTDDNSYQGKRPLRTFLGQKYEGGFSDHLPIVADFTLSKKK